MAAFSKFAGFSYLQANNRIDFYVTGNSISWQHKFSIKINFQNAE